MQRSQSNLGYIRPETSLPPSICRYAFVSTAFNLPSLIIADAVCQNPSVRNERIRMHYYLQNASAGQLNA